MTREIQFRAWDNNDKKMLYDGACHDDCDGHNDWDGHTCNFLSINFDGSLKIQCNDDGGKNGLHEHSVEQEQI